MTHAALAAFIADGHYAAHIRRMRMLYGRRRAMLVNLIERRLGADWLHRDASLAGLHLVLTLPPTWTTCAWSRRARGVLTRPLSRYADPALRRPGLLLGLPACPSRTSRASSRCCWTAWRKWRASRRARPRLSRQERIGDRVSEPRQRRRERAALRTPWSSKLVLKTACACALCAASREKRSASSASSASEYSYWKRPDEACVVRFQAAALRPCSRNSVSSGCVLAQTAGTLFSGPAGASTTVHRAQITQQGQRAGRRGGAVEPAAVAQLDGDQMLVHAPRAAWPRASRRIQGGNWKCTAPSLPGRRSGSSASV